MSDASDVMRGGWTLIWIDGYDARGHAFGDALVHISGDSLGRLAHLYDTEQDEGLVKTMASEIGEHLAAVYLDADAVMAFHEAKTTGQPATIFYTPTRPPDPVAPPVPHGVGAAGAGSEEGTYRDLDSEPVPLTIWVTLAINDAFSSAYVVPPESYIEDILEMKRAAFEIDSILWGVGEEEDEQKQLLLSQLSTECDAIRADAAQDRIASRRATRLNHIFTVEDVSRAAIRQFWQDVAPLWAHGGAVGFGIASRTAFEWFTLRDQSGILRPRQKATLNPSLAAFLGSVLLRTATKEGWRNVRVEPLPVASPSAR